MELIHKDASAEALEFFRRWVFGFWLLIIVIDPFPSLAYLPSTMFQPTGLLMICLPEGILPLFFNEQFLIGLKILTVLSLLAVLFNKYRTFCTILSCLLLTWHQGFIRSFGHINHSEISLLYAAYLLTLFSLADSFWKEKITDSSMTKVNLNSISLIVILTVVCFIYSFMGIFRIINGGIEIFFSDSMKFWIIETSNMAGYYSWHLDHLILQKPWILKTLNLGFPILTVFEIFAPLCLIFRWFRYAFLFVLIPFHILTWLFMNIIFWEQLALYILFINFTHNFKPKKIKI